MTRRKDPPQRLEIISEWDRWVVDNPPGGAMHAMTFFQHLQNDKSQLLDFRDKYDKWQTVHSWLISENRTKD